MYLPHKRLQMSPHASSSPLTPTSLPQERRLGEFLERYGELMTAAELVRIFRFPSARAFRRAVQNGIFPVPIVQVPGRRGRFAETRDVVAWLEGLKRAT